jgi:hypothetical protein
VTPQQTADPQCFVAAHHVQNSFQYEAPRYNFHTRTIQNGPLMLNQECRKLSPDETWWLWWIWDPSEFPALVEHHTPVIATAEYSTSWGTLTDINSSPLSNQHPLKLAQSITANKIMGGETYETAKPKSSYPVRSAHPVGQWIPDLYKSRIGQFYAGGQYEENNLRA